MCVCVLMSDASPIDVVTCGTHSDIVIPSDSIHLLHAECCGLCVCVCDVSHRIDRVCCFDGCDHLDFCARALYAPAHEIFSAITTHTHTPAPPQHHHNATQRSQSQCDRHRLPARIAHSRRGSRRRLGLVAAARRLAAPHRLAQCRRCT